MAVRRRTVTLADVAARAGVSLKTASNAINGTGRMSSVTRERVEAVVFELGYKVNSAARNLTLGRTGTIALAVPTLRPAYLAELAEAVVEAARERDLGVHVTTYPEHEPGASGRYLRDFNATLNDGLLLSLAEHEALEPSDFDVDFPLVCLGTRSTHGRADKVATDDVADGHAAARFLYSRGVTSLAVVGAHRPFDASVIAAASEGNAEMRMRGIGAAAREAGRDLDPRLVGVTGYDWTIGSGFRTAQAVIASGVPFDGVVCLNDGLAIGVISALREAGYGVPDEVQVIGFDDIEESAFLSPPLTTMDSRIDWIAPTALDRLLSRIDQGGDSPVDLRARSKLVERGTTK